MSACHAAAAWSRRSPRRAACPRASCAPPARAARSCARSAPRRRAASSPGTHGALRLRLRDETLLHRQLRGGGVPRDARTRIDAAAVQLAAQRRRQRRPLRCLQAHHLTGPAGQRLLAQAEQQLLGFLRAHVTGFCRQDERQLLEQVVPGPGRMLARHQDQGLGQCPGLGLGLGRGRSGRRPARAMLARPCAGAARVRHRQRDPGQFAAERGVPPPRECVPVDRARSARGRAYAPTPVRVRALSRAPAPCGWSRRPSAPG